MPLWRILSAAAIGVVLVGGLVWSLSTRIPAAAVVVPAQDPSAPSTETAAMAALRRALAEERDARLALAAEVEWLRSLIQDDAEAADLGEATATSLPASLEVDDTTVEDSSGKEPMFNEKALVEHGVPADEAARLRATFEKSEMELLYLRDQAIREGWHGKGRYALAVRDLRNGLREEIGDESFDMVLFASGRKNRALLKDVMNDSPGGAAGLEPGDVVLRYDGELIFSPTALTRATHQGKAGAPIAMDVLRRGEEIRVYLPRGPIGAQLKAVRRPPHTRYSGGQ